MITDRDEDNERDKDSIVLQNLIENISAKGNTRNLFSISTLIWDRSGHTFNLSSKEDTIELLEDLKKLNEANL